MPYAKREEREVYIPQTPTPEKLDAAILCEEKKDNW